MQIIVLSLNHWKPRNLTDTSLHSIRPAASKCLCLRAFLEIAVFTVMVLSPRLDGHLHQTDGGLWCSRDNRFCGHVIRFSTKVTKVIWGGRVGTGATCMQGSLSVVNYCKLQYTL